MDYGIPQGKAPLGTEAFFEEMEAQYQLDQLQPQLKYLPPWAERSEKYRSVAACELDIDYDSGPRSKLDFFPAEEAGHAPTLVFIHGGYWQKGDKSVYSFLAEPFVARGVSFLALSYDLCPTVSITQIAAQVQRAVTWIWNNGAALGLDRDDLHIGGHSAGAHLSAMMLTTDWAPVVNGLSGNLFKSGLLVSGIFDLAPLLFTSQKKNLNLDEEQAQKQSPVRRSLSIDSPLLVASGELESAEFNRQSDLCAQVFGPQCRGLERYVASGCNHFEIVEGLADPGSPLFSKALALIKR